MDLGFQNGSDQGVDMLFCDCVFIVDNHHSVMLPFLVSLGYCGM